MNLSTRQVFGVVSAALAVAAVEEPSVAEAAAYNQCRRGGASCHRRR
ncbi:MULTISPECIES: hypothetical protein [unclassified Streptomyces]|nr:MULTISPECIES: hypothetical protein [unclassified Streptomyces]MBT2376321.1 hypothetical protein [Streptomyces sp. ISL-111]